MPNISKTSFVRDLRGKSIDVEKLKDDRRIPEAITDSAARADLNRDGQIRGDNEAGALFSRLDHFDRNGSRHSMTLNDNIRNIMGHAESPQNRVDNGDTGATGSISREGFVNELKGREIEISDLAMRREIPAEVREAAAKADFNRDGKIRGNLEHNALFGKMDHFDRDGNANTMKRTNVLNAMINAAKAAPASATGWNDETLGNFQLDVNPRAVERGMASGLGRRAATQVPKYAEVYKQASELTGVPATLIAAVHGNESQFGTYTPSSRGPESGFGLDPRFVKTNWGQGHLNRYGLGNWQRGKDNDFAVLQSAVVAAEHLKRQANYAGIKVDSTMSQGELAGAVTSYVQGIRGGKRALQRGSSWLLKPSDSNPHPLHPGGTSIGSRGQTIRVAPSRKEGLLRWDVLIPIIQGQLENTRV